MEYKLLTGDANQLSEKVTKYLNDGYQLYGYTTATFNEELEEIFYSQVVIKEKK